MRNRFFTLLSALLILVLAVPAAAGGPDDNGNGMRTVVEDIQDFDTALSMPICQDGADVGTIRDIPAHHHTVVTIRHKTDDSRVDYWRIGSTVSDDGAYRTDHRERQVVNGIVIGTGHPNVYNIHTVETWSDPDGVYAELTAWSHNRWDKDGNQISNHYNTGLVCLRDTITP